MKARILFILTLNFFMIHSSKLHTSEAKAPQYQFAAIIRPSYAKDAIFFIKKLSDNYLIFFDRKGIGELRSTLNNYSYVAKMYLPGQFYPHNTFLYQDKNKNQLIVGFRKNKAELYLHALDNSCSDASDASYDYKKINITHATSFFQDFDNRLYMLFKNANLATEIFPEWGMDCLEEEIKHTQPIIYSPDLEKPEGLVMPCCMLTKDLIIPNDAFDLSSVTGIAEAEIDAYKSMPEILCYHKTLDGTLFCGHDGFITIWSHKK